LSHGATTFLLAIIPCVVFSAGWIWWFVVSVLGIVVFFSSRAGWLTQEVQDIDILYGNNQSLERDNQALRVENEQLRETNASLKKKIVYLERLNGQVAPKVRAVEPVPSVAPVQAKPQVQRPRNAEAALRIHQAWMLDATGGSQISRSFLMANCNLTRVEVEEGWLLLESLGFAQKESNHPSAKWMITNTDSHDLSVSVDNHITSATAGVVHNL
jgi:hypothetical protein